MNGSIVPGVFRAPGERHPCGYRRRVIHFARDLRSGPNAVALRCINVEADKGRFESLQSATQEFIPDVVEKNIRPTFVEAIPEILNLIGDAAAFFFIDPFGTKDIPFEDLLPIFQRKARTEVLITLHTDGIAKKAGWFAKLESSVLKDRENARKLTEHLAAAVDIPLAKLRAGWEDSKAKGGAAVFDERVQRWYVQRLRNPKRTRFECSQSFKVLYRPDRHSSSVCFHLVFGTQKEIGLFKMNNAMAGALEDFYSDLYRGTLFPEYTEEREQEIGRKAMRREILQHFATAEFTIDDVKRHGMQETDYVLKEGDYRDVVFEMRRNDELTRIDSGRISKKSRFRVVPGVQP